MNYINYSDLSEDIRGLSNKIPRDIDLVAGIPRSGIIPATMFALLRNIPFVTTAELEHDIMSFDSDRLKTLKSTGKIPQINKILVIDDSYNTGRQMKQTKEQLKDIPYIIEYAAVYGKTDSKMELDYYQRIVSHPRVFEWNLFHSDWIKKSCVDMDGVLCLNPDFIETDPEQMRDFINNAYPLYIPTPTIHAIVTNRLEKFRPETEAWLKKHNVSYNKLIMSPHDSPEQRRKAGNHGKWKAKQMKKVKAKFFIESSIEQATVIKKRTGAIVFCVDEMEML